MGNDNSEGSAWQAKHFIPKPLIARVTTLYGEQLSVEEKERETECASGGPGSPMVASATSSPMVTAPGSAAAPPSLGSQPVWAASCGVLVKRAGSCAPLHGPRMPSCMCQSLSFTAIPLGQCYSTIKHLFIMSIIFVTIA